MTDLPPRQAPRGTGALIASLAYICSAFLPLQLLAQGDPPWARAVDGIFAQYNSRTSPGCAVAVFHNGRIAYEQGYGMADLENDVPITPQSVFYMGSVSKQFAAMTAALAIQKNAMSLDDDVRKFIPELPSYGSPITIRHLIHHTSGVRDINTLLSVAGRRGDEAYDNNDVLRYVVRQKALNFAPGSEYLYTNSGYALLAIAVERSTGVPFHTFAQREIFDPLGMSATHFHTNRSRLVPHRVYAYTRSANGTMSLNYPVNERAGAGGVFSNVRDLLHWDENFYTGKVGGMNLIRQLHTPGRLNNGDAITYAWGLMLASYRGDSIVEHSGSLGGFRTHLIRFPARHFSVAALCNMASINPGNLVRAVADSVIGDQLAPRPQPVAAGRSAGAGVAPGVAGGAAAPAQPPPVPELARYAGVYHSEEVDASYILTVQNERLNLRRYPGALPAHLLPQLARGEAPPEGMLSESGSPLTYEAGDRFQTGSTTLRFSGAQGRADTIRVDAGRVTGLLFVRR